VANLVYAVGRDLPRLQPLVLVGGQVYAKTHKRGGPDALVTALGVVHSLRPLCSVRVVMEHQARLNRDALTELLAEKTRERAGVNPTDPLDYFLLTVLPAVQASNGGTTCKTDDCADAVTHPLNMAAALERAVKGIPMAELPTPSLWVLGRVWMLAEGPVKPGGITVCVGTKHFGLTGRAVTVRELAAAWHVQAREFLDRVGIRLAEMAPTSTGTVDVATHRRNVELHGHTLDGDLLFLAGPPARLGHLLLPHHNRDLRRRVNRDVAITLVFDVRPTAEAISTPRIYQFGEGGRWVPIENPSFGFCLGKGAPGFDSGSPGLSLVNYLRWAVIRVTKNGKFHE